MTESGGQNGQVLSPAEIGQALKTAREESGISLMEVAEQTCISQSHIKAIEAGDFDQLPGVGYVPGFLRNYCQVVNIDPEPVVSAFKISKTASLARPEYRFPVQALVPKMASPMIALIIVCLGLGGYVFWIFASEPQPRQLASETAAPQLEIPTLISQEAETVSERNAGEETALIASVETQSSAPDETQSSASGEAQIADGDSTSSTQVTAPQNRAENASEEVATDLAAAGAESSRAGVNDADVAGSEDLVADAADRASDENQTDDTGSAGQAVELASATATQDSSANSTAQSDQQTTPAASETALREPEAADAGVQDSAAARGGVSALATPRAPERELIITANAPSWVEIAKRDGEVLVSKLLQAGEKLVTAMDDELLLSTGNAGGLMLKSEDIDSFQMGKVGEILRDMPLSREGVRVRYNLTTY